MEGKVRWGILGPGKIAHSFARDLLLVDGAALSAVASRSKEKAESFKNEYGAGFAYGSYEELFRSPEVDVIYIATPHTTHVGLSIEAMENGKHVLCEKPLGVNAPEVSQMIRASRKNGVFLMEAMWSRFNPSIIEVKNLLEQGVIGTPKYLQADFGFYALDRDKSSRLLNPDLAGGSLLDIGIYPVFLAYILMGKPDGVLSKSKTIENGVEVQTSILFDYRESQALLFSGLTARTHMEAIIGGTEGTLYLHPRWHEAQGYSLEKEGERTSFELPTLGKGYSHEIQEVHRCLKAKISESDMWSHQNSLDLIGLLDAIRKQNAVVFPFEGQ